MTSDFYDVQHSLCASDTSTCSSFDVKGVAKPKSKKYAKTRSRSPYTCSSSPSCMQHSSSRSLSPGKSNYLKYIHIESGLLFLVTTLIYLNKIQHVSCHSIANARAVLPALSKLARIASVLR